MRTRIMSVPLLIVIALVAILAGGRAVNSQQPPTAFACLYKASPDFEKRGPRPEDMPVMQDHVKYMRTLAEQGSSVFAGHTLTHGDNSFGLIVVKADSEAAARKIMEADPIVHAGLVLGTVIPFGVATVGKDASALK